MAKNTNTNPIQQAVQELADKGVAVKDPATGKPVPVQHLEEGKKKAGRPAGPLSEEEKAKRMETRQKNNALSVTLLQEAQAKMMSGDLEESKKILAQLQKLADKKIAPSEKVLTRLKVNDTVRKVYESKGGDAWLIGILNGSK